MNFDRVLSHHLLDHRYSDWMIAGINFGISSHLVMIWIICAVTIGLLGTAARVEARPARMLRGGVEAVVLYVRDDMLHPIFHEATETYLPYFLTLFFFLLIANLCGLIPYASAVTGNISVTAALAGCTFVLVHLAGVKEQGPIEYVKHITPGGLPFWLVPLIFLIELLGLCAKCIALCIRLFANMISGHVVSLCFLSLIFIFAQASRLAGLGVAPAAVGLALFVYTLDVLVAVIQAFIFTILTALFVGGAVHPH